MKNYRYLVALGIGSLALSRTYTGTLHTFWLVYSIVAMILYFIGLLFDIFTPDEAKRS